MPTAVGRVCQPCALSCLKLPLSCVVAAIMAAQIMHGTGNANEAGVLQLGTEIADIISTIFPSFAVGSPAVPAGGLAPNDTINDSKKAKSLLGATLRPVEETIRDCVESAIELGLIVPQIVPAAATTPQVMEDATTQTARL
jgi:hypothetical protein